MRAARSILALGAVVVGAWAQAAPAAALQPGVFLAPGSPSGHEYSFPLSVLRNMATGHLPQAAAGAGPLFGAGITDTASRSGRPYAPSRRPPSITSDRTVNTGPGSAGTASVATSTPLTNRAIAGLIRRDSSAPTVLLIGVGVLLGGVAIGGGLVLLRRGQH